MADPQRRNGSSTVLALSVRAMRAAKPPGAEKVSQPAALTVDDSG